MLSEITAPWSLKPTAKQLRSFAAIVGGIFLAIGLWPLWHGQEIRTWALVVTAFLLIPGLLLPISLSLPYRAWMVLGGTLGWINTRILLAIVFYLVLTPVALILRLKGRNSLNLGFDPAAPTYAIPVQARDDDHLQYQF